MSTIEKLSIRGIRSFGSNNEDAQSITFSSPVTLILGENGCGKTTIIECLKYALTGESPPGSDRGKNFVHDPKIFNLSDSMGQIKVLIRNTRGERISVCRSMKVVNRRGKYTFETLESIINYVTGTGDKSVPEAAESISKRCIDIDAATSTFMGVSKAVINNVLLCHQEDSSWPLDEAKKLKEKFDAIFGITEFNKTIEKIIKTRKEKTDELKIKETHLSLVTHIKNEMQAKSMQLKKSEEKCEGIDSKCKELDESLEAIDQRLHEIRNIEGSVDKHNEQKVEYQMKLANCDEQITGLRKKIKTVMIDSSFGLDDEIERLSKKRAESNKTLAQMEATLNKLKADEDKLQKNLIEFEKERAISMQDIQRKTACMRVQSEKTELLCKELHIATADEFTVATAMPKIIKALGREKDELAELSAQHEHEDQKLQVEVDNVRIDLVKAEENISSLRKQKASNESELNNTKRQLRNIQDATRELTTVVSDLDVVTENYNSLSNNLNEKEVANLIRSSKMRVAHLQKYFHKLDERLTYLNSVSKLTTHINLNEKELEKKEKSINSIKEKQMSNLQKIFTDKLSKNYRNALELKMDGLRKEINLLGSKLKTLVVKEQRCKVERQGLSAELTRCENEMEESKQQIFEKCSLSSYEDFLAMCKSSVAKYQHELGTLSSLGAVYQQYIKKIEEIPGCPLCKKNMSTKEVGELKVKLSDKIHKIPEGITKCEKLLKVEQKKFEELLQLKPVLQNITKLEECLPGIKKNIEDVDVKLASYEKERISLESRLDAFKLKMELSNAMLGDMSLLDQAIRDVSQLKEDTKKLKAQLMFDSEVDTSIENIQAKKITVNRELELERTRLENMQQNFEKAKEALKKICEKKDILKDEQIRLQKCVQSLPSLQSRLSEVEKNLKMIETERQLNEGKAVTCKKKLEEAILKKTDAKKINRKKLDHKKSSYERLLRIYNELQRINNEVLDYEKLDLEAATAYLDANIESTQDNLKEVSHKIFTTCESLDTIKEGCSKQEILERDLKDNLELRTLMIKHKELTEKLKTIVQQLASTNIDSIYEEKVKLHKNREKCTACRSELYGKISEIRSQMKKLINELDEPKYKNSLNNYKSALYEVDIIRNVVTDLSQYRIALEWSLIKFHSSKMKKINFLIREYWRLIYKGNDIDYIQIDTEEENPNLGTDRRRSFNYRVVQSKNGFKIEMRGRCSAGQRVLASLIIRMALAETFSSNCGILALDEPTTNLDRMNIISLCDALNRIVDERKAQLNFLLIIITHDENFISALGRIDGYHRVSRNHESKSVISKVKLA